MMETWVGIRIPVLMACEVTNQGTVTSVKDDSDLTYSHCINLSTSRVQGGLVPGL